MKIVSVTADFREWGIFERENKALIYKYSDIYFIFPSHNWDNFMGLKFATLKCNEIKTIVYYAPRE